MATILQIGLENTLAATILATLVAALSPVLKRRPALRHCLYLVVLLKLVTPPLWRVPIIPTNEATEGIFTEPREVTVPGEYPFVNAVYAENTFDVLISPDELPEIVEVSSDPPIALPVPPASTLFRLPTFPWVDLLGAVWVGGSLVCLILSIDRIRRFRSVLGLVKPAPESVEDLVSEVAERLDLGRRPRVGMVAGAISPMVWSLGFRPFLLLPAELWARLDNRQRTTLLAHEIAHLKRGDDWVRLFELTVTILFWWLPIVWRVRSTLREAEEQCCDAWVVWAYPEASKAYAETLVETVDFLSGDRSPVPAFASGIGRVQHLKRRLSMIMKGTTPRTLGFGGTLAALTLSALLLPMSPTLGQNPDERREEKTVSVIRHDDADSSADVLEKEIVASGDVERELKVISEDDAKAREVRIVGDKPTTTKTKNAFTFTITGDGKDGTIAEAVAKLRDSLNGLQGKEKKSGEDEAMIKALKQVIDTLGSVNATWIKKPGTATALFRRADSSSLTNTRSALHFSADAAGQEQKASQNELVAMMRKLEAEAKESQAQMRKVQDSIVIKHKQIAEIAHKLASLQMSAGGEFEKNASDQAKKAIDELHNTMRNLHGQMAPIAPVVPVPPVPPTKPARPSRPEQLERVLRDQRPDQDRRIDELEKKLDRILNRLESKDKRDAESSSR